MTNLTDSSPILPRPHVLRGYGTLRLRGTGEVVFDLQGCGQVTVQRGRSDSLYFTGDGLPRHVTATDTIISNARGRLVIDGDALRIECRDGPIAVSLSGHFVVELDGTGHGLIETSRGRILRWGLDPRRLRLSGSSISVDAA